MKRNRQLSKFEFEQVYADEARLPLERLEALGMEASPCDCPDPHCRGWQMTSENERQSGRVAVGAHTGEPG